MIACAISGWVSTLDFAADFDLPNMSAMSLCLGVDALRACGAENVACAASFSVLLPRCKSRPARN